MRISVSGTHSTGKSVLAAAAYEALNAVWRGRVHLIPEVAREVIAKGFPLDDKATVDSYINYVMAQLREERQSVAEHVISDRSFLDLLAYIRTNADPQIPSYFVEMVEEISWLDTRFFDVYCYLPIEFPLVEDGVRGIDEDYRAAVDETLCGLLREYGVKYVTVTGSLAERVNQVVNLVRRGE